MSPGKRISETAVLERARRAFSDRDAPTMDELAVATGVSRASLYQLFGSRRALLEILGVQQPKSLRDQIVEAGAELLAEGGLARLSLDEVALRAGASRATVYRLFPGKGPLFREVALSFVPMQEAQDVLSQMRDRPPAEVIPALASTFAGAGRLEMGVLRCVLLELTRGRDDSEALLTESLLGMEMLAGYLSEQMAEGRLCPMHPILALQSFIGPIMVHLLSRPILEQRLAVDLPLEEALREFAAAWLRAMTPPPAPAS